MQETIGDYHLEQILGEGAAGVVYLAVRNTDGLVVALKVFRRRMTSDPQNRRRITHEARTAANMNHPNLLPIVEEGEVDGEVFLALEYAPGGTLEGLIASRRLSVDETVDIARDVCDGLSALHTAGIIHRDVKPSNIVFRKNGAAALTDFGLVKGEGYTALTQVGRVLGTLGYLAPELINGSPASPASDLYSLSCVLYSCLAGRPPFETARVYELAFAHLNEIPADIRDFRPDAPADLAAVLSQGLAKDPSLRPPTAIAYAILLKAATASGTSATHA